MYKYVHIYIQYAHIYIYYIYVYLVYMYVQLCIYIILYIYICIYIYMCCIYIDIDVGLSTARILPSPDHGSLKQPKSRSISNNHSLPLKRFKKGLQKNLDLPTTQDGISQRYNQSTPSKHKHANYETRSV
jgi:hypothetical protein